MVDLSTEGVLKIFSRGILGYGLWYRESVLQRSGLWPLFLCFDISFRHIKVWLSYFRALQGIL